MQALIRTTQSVPEKNSRLFNHESNMKNKYNLKEQNIQLAHHNITICTQHTIYSIHLERLIFNSVDYFKKLNLLVLNPVAVVNKYITTLCQYDLKKVGKWVPLCCTLGGGVDLGLGYHCIRKTILNGDDLSLFEAKLMENLALNFLTLDINTNNFMNFELQMLIKKDCTYHMRNFVKNLQLSINSSKTTIKKTHKEPCIKFSKLFGHPKIFYRHFKNNFSKKSKISVIPLTLTFSENFKYFQ
ncbi:hypothetical protein AGLY_012851 [Aphis glycines]|uniref:Uncharacterized protein n=1 Tax=Aphis glycines TaxID=307491 RepID=A0A6G0TA11_APHGL|nr:hypothetical protein AGLY_012851 [Aphis glycines]